MVTQPSGAVDGDAFTGQPVVKQQNGSSQDVHQSGVSVSVAIGSGSGSLSGTTTVTTDSNGVATFTNLVITGTGSHTLTFTSSGLTSVTSSSFTVSSGGGGSYLYDTDWSDVTPGSFSTDQSFTSEGQVWTAWASGATVAIVNDGGAHVLECSFTADSNEHVAGITNTGNPFAGTGKKLHVAMLVEYTFASAFTSHIQKTFRLMRNGAETLCATFNNQFGQWRIDCADAGGGLVDQDSGTVSSYGPNSLRGATRWVEIMVDYTTTSAPVCKCWVDGVLVLNGSASGTSFPSGDKIDGLYLFTTFNGPTLTGKNRVHRLIVHTSQIGIPS